LSLFVVLAFHVHQEKGLVGWCCTLLRLSSGTLATFPFLIDQGL